MNRNRPTSATELEAAQLYQSCDPAGLQFHTTADLEDLHAAFGQARALDALEFGVGVSHEGYNLYVMGTSGLGKHTTVSKILEELAAQRPQPPDWCYVNNFRNPHNPRALRLPLGGGVTLQRDMQSLVKDLQTMLPAAFESDEYRTRVQELNDEFKAREEKSFAEVADEARRKEIMLLRTPGGYTLAPIHNDNVLDPKEFSKLSDAKKQEIEQKTEEVRQSLRRTIHQIAAWQQEHSRRLEQLNEETASIIVNRRLAELESRYHHLPDVLAYLAEVKSDLIENADEFRQGPEEKTSPFEFMQRFTPFNRYFVNVVVDNSANEGAPVVYEDNPTYQNLIGRIEHLAQLGTLLTDFTLIKSGALHRASGGYLLLDAYKVLVNPFAWDALKRVLRAREVRIQSLEQMLSLVSTISLEPEPIPLDVKVVLIGERLLYYMLNKYDPEFSLLFKVEADFAEDIDRTPDNTQLYARMIASLQRREKLQPMDRGAVARLIEYAARLADDGEKLSLHMGGLVDLLRESDYWSRRAGKDVIRSEDVEQTIATRIHRADQVRERAQESILRNIRLIDTEGSVIAQINGLAVVQLGKFAFGFPSRITATARFGEGKVVDIEREVKLGGAIHSKGVLILSSYLASRFAHDQPLSLSASLAFEQSYEPVEGDSASVAELCALLSALSRIPLRQELAVTGSVNQQGEVQAIGGVNEKIEGFFDICRARGLNGNHGVIIPEANRKHLMLRRDVVEAVRDGRFHVYAVTHADTAMEILTGMPAGSADAAGEFPDDTVNGKVQRRLRELSRLQQSYRHPERKQDDEHNDSD